jgi:predicted DsbA family dithiol-disulfide isomerase
MDKLLGPEKANQIRKHFENAGSAEGITFDWSGRSGNSRLAHQLMHLAGQEGPEAQTKVAEELWRGYFEQRREIADIDFLTNVGKAAGLDVTEVRDYLQAEKGKEVVEKAEKEVRESGVTGVPQFYVEETYNFDREVDVAKAVDSFVSVKEATA